MSEEPEAVRPGVGARVRQIRREHQLSARDLATRAGVSAAYLSRLEHDKVSPTVATLSRLMQAMGESIVRAFGDDDAGPVVRRADRRVVRNHGIDDLILTPSRAAHLEVLETVLEPGASSGEQSYEHPGDEECVVVLDGTMTVWLDEQRYDLAEGDAITFPCRTPHRWSNGTSAHTRALWIITPPGY